MCVCVWSFLKPLGDGLGSAGSRSDLVLSSFPVWLLVMYLGLTTCLWGEPRRISLQDRGPGT